VFRLDAVLGGILAQPAVADAMMGDQ